MDVPRRLALPSPFSRDAEDCTGISQPLDQLIEVGKYDVDALAVCLMKPVHVSDDIAGKAYLLYSGNPLIDVGYHGLEEVAIDGDDLTQVRK